MSGYVYIFLTIFFTVYSQVVIKWKSHLLVNLPEGYLAKLQCIFSIFMNPWIVSSVIATFLAGVSWMLVMSKFEMSFAYPFISINFLLMLFAGFFIFGEAMTLSKIIGSVIIVIGLIVLTRN